MGTTHIKKCTVIFVLVKNNSTSYLKHTHKFAIECPKTVEDALELEKQNGNSMWANAIAKQMKNIDPIEYDSSHLMGSSSLSYMIFDINMKELCWKARSVAPDVPAMATNASGLQKSSG